jgi:hypothetical protein
MRSWSLASAVVCCVVAAGCGGASLAHRAEATCRDNALTIGGRADALAGLREPRLAPLVRALRAEADDLHWLRVAAASGDTELAMSATNLGRRAGRRAHAAAAALGAPACAG